MLSFVRLPLPPPHICFRQHRFVCTSRLTHLATPQAFQSKTKFVVLSDLHVKRETLQTCLQALQITHDEAVKRNAAILFLGDFWHARGNLPVDPLNAVLTQLSTWKVPIIMIPGNHDLVSRTGNGVSLVPLATTLGSHRCLLITKPTVCLNALFLPYMHDTMALKSTLKEASTLPNKLNAIFCHAEVAGARLADRIVSPSDERTLNPQDFPSTTRVYSGHIHRPHTVSDSIRYVGSPYQVSAGEHDQHKMLLILDREQHWKVVDSVPIDIGSRHYTIRFNTPFTLPTLRRGDRVAIYAASPPHHFVDLLRDRGVRVELRSLPEDQTVQPEHDVAIASMEPRISPGAMSNTDLFREYAVIKRLPSNVTTASLNILHEIGGRPTSNISSKDVIIMWQSVTLRGFGTFFDSVTYPLQKRGLVMLTGRDCSHDDVLTGRTNATGKTTLIMAPLWAMTGRTDARPDGSVEKGVSLEMVHDDAKDCEVSVRLHLEGERALMEVFEMMTSTEREETGLVSTNGRRATQVLNVAVTRRSTRNGSLSNTRYETIYSF